MLSTRGHHATYETPYRALRTPGRGLKRSENLNAGARTVGPKGKALALHTPFAKNTLHLKGGLTTAGKSRGLVDKTPAPNRLHQDANGGNEKDALGKLPKLVLLETESTASPDIARPSSTRKHARLPRSSVGRKFETPMNKGNYWDVGDVDLNSPEAQLQEPIVEEIDCQAEIEYMPPNTLHLADEPCFYFDLPDYNALAQDFRSAVFSAHTDDAVPQLPNLDEIKPVLEPWSPFPQRELEDDDPFRQAKTKAPLATVPAKRGLLATNSKRPVSTIPPSSKALQPKIQRPATATSIKPSPAPRSTGSSTARTPAVTKTQARAQSTTAKPSTLRPLLLTSRTQQPGSSAAPAKMNSIPKGNGPQNRDIFNFSDLSIEDDFMFDV
ncbi:hypothetical protein FA15DRAFT_671765 [Coprinopsis marcescibilis]|uniref:Uncharacterized protein n=1 Tax=Coprinopsis marcescibilis TaxID=230819 RepID=A0A5C3L1X0_COPMA|nr:hypothetical protein FA15DRAFT_671765 [Coprinopsis marcescibilis]